MAKYLKTAGISASLETLICEAKEKLIIVSPYLKLSERIKELLNDKEREKVNVRFVFGKQELIPSELSFLQNLKYVNLYFSKNLHAKCYLNEKQMLITSMNLYEYSQVNNREMGILIDRAEPTDVQIYDDAFKDVDSIIHNSEDFAYIKAPSRESQPKLMDSRQTAQAQSSKATSIQGGFCIRTGISIPFDLEKPMSTEAFKSWNKYGDDSYAEKFCHYSGEKSNGETSMNKPILRKNWTKANALAKQTAFAKS